MPFLPALIPRRRLIMPATNPDPASTPGWEPEASVSDSMLRRFVTNWAQELEHHSLALGGDVLRRADLVAGDVGRPATPANFVIMQAPLREHGADEFDSALDNFYGFTRGTKTGDVHLFSAWPTPDLTASGWKPVAHLPFMYRPAGGSVPPPPPGLRIEPVRDEEGLRGFEQTIVRGFPFEEPGIQVPGAAFPPELLNDARSRMWVGWEGDSPVCAASTFVSEGINNVTFVATVPEARRRGYGAAVTWQATIADPSLPALLVATDEGRPVYEKMGYVPLFRFVLWSRNRPGPQSRSEEPG
jgi:GNAT superfamily N-acetyltransferase